MSDVRYKLTSWSAESYGIYRYTRKHTSKDTQSFQTVLTHLKLLQSLDIAGLRPRSRLVEDVAFDLFRVTERLQRRQVIPCDVRDARSDPVAPEMLQVIPGDRAFQT